MKKNNAFTTINDNELKIISGGNRTANRILADMFDAYGYMVTYQHMKPSPINN